MWNIETSAIGRIAVPPRVPEGFALFVTTSDFEGRIHRDSLTELAGLIGERLGRDATLTTCLQVHGAALAYATGDHPWRECDSCDALWATDKGRALGIKVADCLPVTMIDPVHSVIANVHSGWRGAVQRITIETLDTIRRAGSFDPEVAFAFLGPTIRVCCFEVGEEVAARFDERFVDRSWPKPHLDLVAMTTHALLERGFHADRISDSEMCTRCEGSLFHSYRRSGKGGGRNLAIVAQ